MFFWLGILLSMHSKENEVSYLPNQWFWLFVVMKLFQVVGSLLAKMAGLRSSAALEWQGTCWRTSFRASWRGRTWSKFRPGLPNQGNPWRDCILKHKCNGFQEWSYVNGLISSPYVWGTRVLLWRYLPIVWWLVKSWSKMDSVVCEVVIIPFKY